MSIIRESSLPSLPANPLFLRKTLVIQKARFVAKSYITKTGIGMETAKTRSQIADEYGISRKTLSRWLKKAGIEIEGYLISPKQQELIYQTFGDPRKKAKQVA